MSGMLWAAATAAVLFVLTAALPDMIDNLIERHRRNKRIREETERRRRMATNITQKDAAMRAMDAHIEDLFERYGAELADADDTDDNAMLICSTRFAVLADMRTWIRNHEGYSGGGMPLEEPNHSQWAREP